MKLKEFLNTLKTKDVKIVIVDNEENEHIKFYSEGFEGVEDDLLELDVQKWFISSATSIKVYIDIPTDEPTL